MWVEQEYGTSMSEHQTLTDQSAGFAAVAPRPRISADAFRNLAARLKKPETSVPDFKPAATPLPVVATPGPQAVAVEPQVFAPAPLALEPAPLALESAPLALEPASLALEPAPLALEPAPLALEPAPLAFEPPPAFAEVFSEPEVVASEPHVEVATFAPSAFPPLELPPGFVPNIVATETAPSIVEPTLVADSTFSENFTYVPEKGESAEPAKPDLSGVEEAIKAEIAQRAAEIELENIWRMMLSKPSNEDRANYLREAAEIHAGDEEWNRPEPEFDLSRIEPAYIPVVINHPEFDQPQFDQSEYVQPTIVAPVATDSNIPNLSDGQDLAELARSLLDMMAAGNASGLPQERALASDTLLRLVPKLELKPMMMLAQRLAIMDAPPHLLVARLIRDPRVEVSGPLLEDCAQITDRDLETVVAESEPDKLRMIARRRNLSRAISDVLIKSGEPSVVLTLVRNMEAEISHEGFQSLLVLAENHEELLAPMATRQDFTAQYAFELFWSAPSQLRRFILSRFLTDSETLTKILKITMATKLNEEGESEPLNQHVLLEGLDRAARGHIEQAADELSGTMQLSTATIQKILSDLEGDALVVMLKAAGYPRSALAGLLKRMQDAEMPLVSRERDLNDLQNMFETLSFNKARILLTYWDWAQSKTGPYALQH